MKVLLDECADPRCATLFTRASSVSHVRDKGWIGASNGDLVRLAGEEFDVLLTVDSNMRFQQAWPRLRLTVAVMPVPMGNVADYGPFIWHLESEPGILAPGEFVVLKALRE